MAALTGTQISVTYVGLLKTSASTVLSSTAQQITDGSGNNSILYLSTAEVGIGGSPTAGKELDVTGNVLITGDLQVDNININGNTISATSGVVTLSNGTIATTQSQNDNSTKVATTAYVDTAVDGVDTLAEILAIGNTTGGTDIEVSSGDKIIFNNNTELRWKDTSSNEKTILELTNTDDLYFGGSFSGSLIFVGGGSYTERFRLNDDGNLLLPDNGKLLFGADSDLQIYHDGSNSYINENGAGVLAIQTNGTEIQLNSTGGEYLSRFIPDAGVKLYYDNSLKFETTAGGTSNTGTLDSTGTITVTGASSNIRVGTDTGKFLAGASNELQIYHDGTHSFVKNTTGNLYLLDDGYVEIGSGVEVYAGFVKDGAVNLYYDNVKKFETTSSGVNTTGIMEITSSGVGVIGAVGNTANDVNIYSTTTGHNGLRMHVNGILPTDNTGTIIDNDADLGDPSYRFKTLYLSANANLGASSYLRYGPDASGSDASVLFGNTSGTGGSLTFKRNSDATAILTLNGDTSATFAGNVEVNGTLIDLDSAGTATVRIDRGATSDAARVQWFNAGSEYFKAGLNDTDNNLWSLLHTCGSGLYFDGSNMRLGFGEDTPDQTLHIKSASTTYVLTETTGTGTSAGFRMKGDASADYTLFTTQGTNQFAIYDNAAGAERMRIRSSGTVGIGAEGFDSQMLTIAAGTLDGAIYATSTDANCFASFRDNSSTANIEFGAIGDNHVLRKDAAEYFIVNNVGDVYNYQSVNRASTYYGYNAGDYSATGGSNNAFGYDALGSVTTGNENVAMGRNALGSLTTGVHNVTVGYAAGRLITTANNNTLVGFNAGTNITTGSGSTFFGYASGQSATTSTNNTGVGYAALGSVTTGGANTAVGFLAGEDTTGGNNSYFGYQAGKNVTTGSNNTLVGYDTGVSMTSGQRNTTLGASTLGNATSANNNVAIGQASMVSTTTGGANVSVGRESMYYNTTGEYNTALGYQSLITNTTGQLNVAVGMQAGYYQTGNYNTCIGGYSGIGSSGNSTGSYNTTLGYVSGQDLTSGAANTLIGAETGKEITTGSNNTVLGYAAGTDITTGNYNVLLGREAGDTLTSGAGNVCAGYQASGASVNASYMVTLGYQAGYDHQADYQVAVGYQALYNTGTGAYGVAVGFRALHTLTSGSANTAVGYAAGLNISTGSKNTLIGGNAGDAITTASNNTCIGESSGTTLSTGANNTFIGGEAGLSATTGEGQVAVGFEALKDCTTGSGNIAIGKKAGENLTTGGSNTFIGYAAAGGGTVSGGANICIGDATGYNLSGGSNNILIGQNAGRTGSQSPSSLGAVTTNSNEIQMGNGSHTGAYIQIGWTTVSDARDKGQIKDVPHGLDFVSQLQPKSFEFKTNREAEETDGIERYGFLAQDVLELEGENPVVVNKNDENKLKMTNDYLVPILVNAIKELKQEIEILKSK